jgi:hypothetical protein
MQFGAIGEANCPHHMVPAVPLSSTLKNDKAPVNVTLPKSHTNSPPTLSNFKAPTFYKNKTKIFIGLAKTGNRLCEVLFILMLR